MYSIISAINYAYKKYGINGEKLMKLTPAIWREAIVESDFVKMEAIYEGKLKKYKERM